MMKWYVIVLMLPIILCSTSVAAARTQLSAQFRLAGVLVTESDDGITTHFNWEPADRVIKYQLVVSQDADFSSHCLQLYVHDNAFTTTALEPQTTYYWKVSAIYPDKSVVNANGVKSFSTPALTITKPRVIVPQGSAIIDGSIGEDEWKSAVTLDLVNFPIGQKDDLEKLPECRVMWDSDNLYISAKIWYTKEGKAQTQSRPRDSMIHNTDSLEMFLFGPGRSKGYHFILNASNSIYDDYGGDTGFNGNWQHAVVIADTCWTLEMAIPFAMMNEAASAGNEWKAEFHVNLNGQSLVPTWSGKKVPFGNIESFGTLVLGK